MLQRIYGSEMWRHHHDSDHSSFWFGFARFFWIKSFSNHPGTWNIHLCLMVVGSWMMNQIFTWKKMVGNHQTSIKQWLFRVPGHDYFSWNTSGDATPSTGPSLIFPAKSPPSAYSMTMYLASLQGILSTAISFYEMRYMLFKRVFKHV